MTPIRFDLLLVGFGRVARRFVRLLQERADALERECGVRWRLVGIATRRHGAAWHPEGLDAGAAVERAERDERVGPPGWAFDGASALDVIALAGAQAAAPDRVVMIETTVLDITAGQPAISHIEAALAAGLHAITANKGPVAFAYRRLSQLADRMDRRFFFEGTVLDGIPIFNFVRETLPVVTVTGFRGIVNSTTNHILTAMEARREFEDALVEMQAAGIAEADASLDVDGWDAAAKTAALVNVLMRGDLTPRDVERTGIRDLSRRDLEAAVRRGRRIRLVAEAGWHDGRIYARVAPQEVEGRDLLANLRGMENAVVLRTDPLGEIAVVELESGLTQTAYALVSDLVAVRRRQARL